MAEEKTTRTTGIVNGKLTAVDIDDGSVNATEFQYLNGVTSPIQTQIDGKANAAHVHDATDVTSGVLPVSRGGTGGGTSTAGFDSLAPTTTKGDLIAFGTASNARFPVGADGYVLTSDSTEALGIRWADGNVVHEYAESDALSSTTSASWQNKISLNFNSVASAYLIQWMYLGNVPVNNTQLKFRVQVDNGSGPVTISSSEWSPSSSWAPGSGVKKVNLVAANTTITVDFTSSVSDKSVGVKEVRVFVLHLG